MFDQHNKFRKKIKKFQISENLIDMAKYVYMNQIFEKPKSYQIIIISLIIVCDEYNISKQYHSKSQHSILCFNQNQFKKSSEKNIKRVWLKSKQGVSWHKRNLIYKNQGISEQLIKECTSNDNYQQNNSFIYSSRCTIQYKYQLIKKLIHRILNLEKNSNMMQSNIVNRKTELIKRTKVVQIKINLFKNQNKMTKFFRFHDTQFLNSSEYHEQLLPVSRNNYQNCSILLICFGRLLVLFDNIDNKRISTKFIKVLVLILLDSVQIGIPQSNTKQAHILIFVNKDIHIMIIIYRT